MRLRASWLSFITVAAGALLAVAPGVDIRAQDQGQGLAVGRPEWAQAVRHDTSRPLREMTPTPAISTRSDFAVKQPPPSPQATQTDTAAQLFAVSPLAATSGVGFDGVGEGNPQFSYNVNYAPPDTTGEAGLTQYVQWVNPSFAVFDKTTGTRLLGPFGGNTLWAGFGGVCETHNDGDPIVQYDQLENRWIMTQFAIQTGNYMQCVAVSKTDDATGAWHRYAFSYSEFPDYPKLGVWPDAYYITFNMFGPGGASFTGGRVCAYDRAKMIIGQPATQVCYQIGYASLLASDLEGTALPPTGTPNLVMNLGSNDASLNVWRFTPNFASPGNSTFTGPASVPVTPFTRACAQKCVPQPGTSQLLDALGDRAMYRLSYRNLGTRQALVVNHSVVYQGVTTIRWYELDVAANLAVTARQHATYAPGDGLHRWMGSIAMDQQGNIGVGYSVSSATMRPSIRFAGREVTDTLNSLSMEENMLTGTGSQLSTLSRWGDYSTMAIDPVDGCTFWYTSEYLQTSGTFNWSTRVGRFKFTSCGAPPTTDPTFGLAVSPASRSIVEGQSTTFTATVTALNGYAGSGLFSVAGLPPGAMASWSNAGFTGSGFSTLTVTTAAPTSPGSYQLAITAEDETSSITQSSLVTLTVAAAPNPDFSISASPASRTVKRGKSTTYTVTVAGTDGFSDVVTFTVSGLQAGATAQPVSVTGSGSTTLTVVTTASATRGTFPLTITGSSGNKTRSATVTLKIQ